MSRLATCVTLVLAAAACASGSRSHRRDGGGAVDAAADGGRRDAAAADAGFDAARPDGAGLDAGIDAAPDATADASGDAGTDAPADAPIDSGCPPGLLRCDGFCVDVRADPTHCGSCDVECAAGERCVGGACTPMAATWSTTAAGYDCATPGVVGSRIRFTCPPGGSAGSLWGTGTYTADSSVCTAAVHAGRITLAAGGAITVEMRAGAAAYAGSTRNGVTSSSYGAWRCSFAIVEPACAPGVAACGDVCTDVETDPLHCGACDAACAAPLACAMGACTCPAGETECAGACRDLATDAANCGACGMACPPTQSCIASACGCAAGLDTCGAVCADLATDEANCGACGMACPAGQTCTGRVCGATAATWSTRATDHDCATPGVIGSRFTYACPAGGAATSAWGTDVYTHDSSICTAAVHVGRIDLAGGGAVTIEMMPGQASYPGSTRNGITTSTWGSWGCSFGLP